MPDSIVIALLTKRAALLPDERWGSKVAAIIEIRGDVRPDLDFGFCAHGGSVF